MFSTNKELLNIVARTLAHLALPNLLQPLYKTGTPARAQRPGIFTKYLLIATFYSSHHCPNV